MFLTVQGIALTYMLTEAILTRLRVKGQYDRTALIFFVDILAVCSLVYFDFGRKRILVFFLIELTVNYLNLSCLDALCSSQPALKGKTRPLFALTNLGYICCVLLACTS